MSFAEFRRAGHWPTLCAAFLYFDVSFCVWYLLGPLGNFVAQDLGLTATQKGLLVATPLLGGSIFRIAMGVLADRIGPRRAGMLGLAGTFVPLLLGWLAPPSAPMLALVALLLGVPGASFAVALPLASRWYPLRYQGLVMGIAGAGNSGTVLAALVLPRLAAHYGWQGAIGWLLLPVAAVAVVFVWGARESPHVPPRRPLRAYATLIGELDTFWFCLFYAITFGGFIGLASFLGIFFHDQYGLDNVAAADLTAACVFLGSFMRPVGGALADRLGGVRMLRVVYAGVAVLLAGLATLPPAWLAAILFGAALALLGAGNGAVFQLVPLRFQRDVGVVTGLVGAAGGLGGFFLPSLLGALRDLAGTYAAGLAVLSAISLWGMTLVLAVNGGWQLTWAARLGLETPGTGRSG